MDEAVPQKRRGRPPKSPEERAPERVHYGARLLPDDAKLLRTLGVLWLETQLARERKKQQRST